MSTTLFRYIFRDLMRIFLLSLGVLAGIMSFGGLLRPLTEHGLGPGQVFRMLAYFLPAMATYSLPVAALFATTMVYGRLSSDNEITACRAAGISALSVAMPAFVLGIAVCVISFVFLFFIVPICTLQVEKIVYSNIAQLVESQIVRNHRIEMDQPDGATLTIFAQDAKVIPAPASRPKDQVVLLVAPVFVNYETSDRENKNKIPAPIDFYMAKRATAYISQDDATGDLYIQAALENGLKLPRQTAHAVKEQSMQAAVENTVFYADPVESPLRENTKFMELSRLRKLLAEPEKSKRLHRVLGEFIRDDQRNQYLERLQDALADAKDGAHFESGGESYVLERGEATTAIRAGRLMISAGVDVAPANLPRLRQVRDGQTVLNVVAHQIQVRAQPILSPGQRDDTTQRRFAIEIDLEDAIVSAGNVSTPRSKFERSFTVPMPQELVDLEGKRVADYRASQSAISSGALNSASRVMQMERNLIRLTNSIKSEIHARASFSLSCLSLVGVGCALGMMFRSGNFLSAFAISVIPALLAILLIISGQHTCENVPWNIKNFNNPLEFGIYMIWTGNVLVLVLATSLMWRLQRQ